MKRTIFLPLAFALLLVSCGNEGPQGIYDKALVDANLVAYNVPSYSSAAKENFDPANALGYGYDLKEDLSLTRGAAVYVAGASQRIYSLYIGDTVGNSFAGNYAFYPSNAAGFYVYYENGSDANVYDGLGNRLYEGDAILGLTFTEGYENGQHEVRLVGTDYAGRQVDLTYCYVPSEAGEMTPVRVDWSLTQFPSSSATTFDLSGYGLQGLTLVDQGNGDCYVIDGIGTIQSSFALPKYPYAAWQSSYFAGGRLVSQVSTALLEDAADYAYVLNGTKYDLIGYRIDLLSGTIEYFDPDYVIAGQDGDAFPSNRAVNDANGDPNLAPAVVYEISGQKALAAQRNVLLDRDGGIAYQLAGNVMPYSFVKMGNGSYFNVDTRSLYDENLVLAHDLSGLMGTYLPGPDAILLQSGTMEALLSPDGDFLIPFAEQTIVAPSYGNSLVYCLGDETLVSYDVRYEEGEYALSDATVLKNLTESYSYALSTAGSYGLYSLIGRSEQGSIASLDVYFGNEGLDSRTGTLAIETTYKAPYLGHGYVRMDIDDGSEEATTVLYRFEA